MDTGYASCQFNSAWLRDDGGRKATGTKIKEEEGREYEKECVRREKWSRTTRATIYEPSRNDVTLIYAALTSRAAMCLSFSDYNLFLPVSTCRELQDLLAFIRSVRKITGLTRCTVIFKLLIVRRKENVSEGKRELINFTLNCQVIYHRIITFYDKRWIVTAGAHTEAVGARNR